MRTRSKFGSGKGAVSIKEAARETRIVFDRRQDRTTEESAPILTTDADRLKEHNLHPLTWIHAEEKAASPTVNAKVAIVDDAELKLLRGIAKLTRELWDAGQIPIESTTLKNLLTDWIDKKDRVASREKAATNGDSE